MVGLMRAPQLDSELRGTLKAAAICDGVHDDVGAARLQAGLLAPAFILRGRDPRPILRGSLALADKESLLETKGWSRRGSTWDGFGGEILS